MELTSTRWIFGNQVFFENDPTSATSLLSSVILLDQGHTGKGRTHRTEHVTAIFMHSENTIIVLNWHWCSQGCKIRTWSLKNKAKVLPSIGMISKSVGLGWNYVVSDRLGYTGSRTSGLEPLYRDTPRPQARIIKKCRDVIVINYIF